MVIKKPLIIFIICLLLLSAVGCVNNRTGNAEEQTQLHSPPALKILYKDQSIDAKRGTYSWTFDNGDGTATGIEADSPAPPELVKDSTPLNVPPGSSLTLSFSKKPKDIAANIWQYNTSIEQTLTDDKISIPESKGLVIYEVTGTWDQGTAYYAFLVNVV